MVNKGFSDKIKTKCLQCSDRHCCLCGKQCSTNIVIHHIIPIKEKGNNSFDNAMPLCFDCHGIVESYNSSHAIGIKYHRKELKKRRDQVYDKHTSPFVPNIHFEIRSYGEKIPNEARFYISNTHRYLSCKVEFVFSVYHNRNMIHKFNEGIYGGKVCWNLNPNSGGDFPPNFLRDENVLKKIPKKVNHLQVQIEATIVDKFGWKHQLLPVSWIWAEDSKGWFFHPFPIN